VYVSSKCTGIWQEPSSKSQSGSVSGVQTADSSTPVGSLEDVSLTASAVDSQADCGAGLHAVTGRSRTSSVSSQASDTSMLASPSQTVRQQSSLIGAEDGVSEADNDDHSSVVASMNKEELHQVYSKALRRGQQYKMKYLQVSNCNDFTGNLM